VADNTTLSVGSGGDTIATDDIGPGVKYQRVKITLGADGVSDGDVATGNPMPVSDAGGALTVDGTISANLNAGTNNIGDVDIASPLGAGTEAAAVRVTVATDSTGVLSIDDNGGSLTVDGTVTANQGTPAATANRWPVQVTDGTDLALVTAAGEVNVLATAQPGTDIGDVTVNNAAGASAVNIQDGGNSITVDGTVTLGAGTANVGDVDIASPLGAGTEAAAVRVTVATDSTGVLSVDDNGGSLTVDATDLDIRNLVRTQDAVASADTTDAIMQGLTARTPAFAIIDEAASGDNEVVAAQGVGNKIRVIAYAMVATSAVTATWRSATTPISGGMALAANGGVSCGYNPAGWFETAANAALNLNLGAAVSVDGHLTYIVVT
jgi:hypothetical protein